MTSTSIDRATCFWRQHHNEPPRVTAEQLEADSGGFFEFCGVAADVTSKSLRKTLKSPRLEYCQVGGNSLHLVSEFEPGWAPALRLNRGQPYVVSVARCQRPLPAGSRLPLDVTSPGAISFFAVARALAERKAEADQRRRQKGFVGAWTDGLMLVCNPQLSEMDLVPGVVYRIEVRVADDSA
jgi:hypothetical protein